MDFLVLFFLCAGVGRLVGSGVFFPFFELETAEEGLRRKDSFFKSGILECE